MKALLKVLILSVLLVAGVSQLAAQSNAERGSVIGAIVGAIVGHQSDEDLAGAGVGAVVGYIIGNEADKRAVYTQRPVVYQEQPRRVIRRDPVVVYEQPRVVYRPSPVYQGGYRRPSYGYSRRTYAGPVVIRIEVSSGSRYYRR